MATSNVSKKAANYRVLPVSGVSYGAAKGGLGPRYYCTDGRDFWALFMEVKGYKNDEITVRIHRRSLKSCKIFIFAFFLVFEPFLLLVLGFREVIRSSEQHNHIRKESFFHETRIPKCVKLDTLRATTGSNGYLSVRGEKKPPKTSQHSRSCSPFSTDSGFRQ